MADGVLKGGIRSFVRFSIVFYSSYFLYLCVSTIVLKIIKTDINHEDNFI